MKYECSVIEDLLPLYKDEICSDASKKMVEEHLEECPKCKHLFEEMDSPEIDELMIREKDEVIIHQAKYFKTKSAVIGAVIAAVFAIPILVCMIVNLASGHGLTWFFIVLAAMFIPTSLFVVPLIAEENRMFLTMTSFTGSVIFLLAVCCIYSHGNWFFIAASSVLFGLTMVFAPFIACRRPVDKLLGNKKGLAVMAADTITFTLMMICIGLHVSTPGYAPMAFAIAAPLVGLAWVIFLICRYLPANGFVKAGSVVTAVFGLGYCINWFIAGFMMTFADPDGVQVYSGMSLSDMLIGVAAGCFIMAIGFLVSKKRKASAEKIAA